MNTDFPDRFGPLLRSWRTARGLSQMELALEADISTRHLSCLESGKASPTPGSIMKLAETLRVPLLDRNNLLIAAGFTPQYGDLPFDDPAMAETREVMERLLRITEPYAAMLVDRHYNTLIRNATLQRFQQFASSKAQLRSYPDNGLELVLSPHGMKPIIVDWPEFARYLLGRCRQLFIGQRDPRFRELLDHLLSLPETRKIWETIEPGEIFPSFYSFKLRIAGITLALQMVVTTFGTHQETTISEYRIVTFIPESKLAQRFVDWLKDRKGPMPV